MKRLLFILLLAISVQQCLFERGHIKRVQFNPDGTVLKEEESQPSADRVQLKKCMYSFVVLFWYNRPFPSTWNDIVADPSAEDKNIVKLKNATIYMDGIDFFPPWTVFMLFLPFPTVPIMRTCGVIEGEIVSAPVPSHTITVKK
ncbi:hypothetical protein EHQ53_10830 [Leptospira langatensis]|uniref:Uncharacterized protein n=1 Tax=Leptospira langatensis TaxID=2484983 RepID=A0A5F1ZS73_9LEPT|nr:hypothetical protein [Leptospira langatensis]TGJ98951.1 hypothetical protein EHO57_15670 [Leptospira langatensis]TGL40480.1 hypothetical protein EHQ53_10830 [Leptospira langatensis]